MKIGIDALSVKPGKTGGGETYVLNLISHLSKVAPQHEFVVFSLPGLRDLFARTISGVTFREVAIPGDMKGAVPARLLFEQFLLPSRIRMLGIDCMLFMGNIMSLACPCPAILNINDMSSFYYRKTFPGVFSFANDRILPAMIALSARRAHMISAISKFTKQEILKYVAVFPKKIAVIYLGVEGPGLKTAEQPAELPAEVTRPYIFTVGTQHLHKNYERLCRAFAAAKKTSSLSYQLVIAGMEGNGTARLQNVLRELACPDIRILGAVSQTHLQGLYQNARAVIFPSLYEGFGLPLLEAMAAGAPVFASNAGPVPEIVEDAAFLFDPLDQQAIEHALTLSMADDSLIGDLRRRGTALISRGSRFSWTTTATEMLSLVNIVMNVPRI